MIIGHWLLIETLGPVGTWSLLAAGSAPRAWKSYRRAVPPRLQRFVTAAHHSGAAVDHQLPPSRHAWSRRRIRAQPLLGPGARVHAVRLWVGSGAPPPPVGVTTFSIDGRARRVEVVRDESGPHCEHDPAVWFGAEVFQTMERFDGALEFAATMARAEPGVRWLDTATMRSADGPRTLLLAARNPDQDRQHWVGVAVDVTEDVAPQARSLESVALDLLRGPRSNRYLAIVDLAQVRLIRWVTEPVPGVRWGGPTDERTVPHPQDRPRILAARADLRAGRQRVRLDGVRLAGRDGDWIVADLEAVPLPHRAPSAHAPEFAVVQVTMRRPSDGDGPDDHAPPK
ncbi:GAF domain-containing protein [Nocardia pneumoniae]|uniref:GAF domain-containing protein n=1 Tax=Nocardia pneumoniae TaxID=228601 RepID=UPI0002D3D992|nr:GAF domain-containing protein [Nocardia pneumoniae]